MAASGYSRSISDGVYALLERASSVFFGFVNLFFMARMLSVDELGLWTIFVTITALVEMIRNGFIRNPFITHLVAADESKKPVIVTASFVLHCLLALGMTLILLVGATPVAIFYEDKTLLLRDLFLLYALNNLIFIAFSHFEYLQVAKMNFKAIFISNSVRLGLLSVYIMAVFFMSINVSLMDIAIVQVIATVISSFVGYYFVRGAFSFSRIIDWPLIKELFHYGKFTFGTNVSSMFVKSSDQWMIGKMISLEGVGFYNPGIRISNLVEVPTTAIANVFFPRVTQRMKESGNEGIRDIYIKSVGLILAITIPMVLPIFIFPELVILLIFGSKYLASTEILQVCIFYTLIIPFNRQFGTVMDGTKRPKINFYLLVLVAVLNIIFNFIFLKAFGLIGSAYATLLSYCVVFILNQIVLYRLFGINTLHVFVAIVEWYKMGWDMFRKKVFKTA